MIGVLLLGILAGLTHALEADHLSAVGALSSNGASRRRLMLRGAAWGVGHTATLLVLCIAVIWFHLVLTDARAAAFECAVGVTLVVLGLDLLRRMRRDKVHFHAHDHGDGAHLHLHSHAASRLPHDRDPHRHAHDRAGVLRALAVGLVHGAAGSAALVALALASTRSPGQAVAYVALFGIGSIAGMAAMTSLAAWPLGLVERAAGWVSRCTYGAIALIACGIGLSLIVQAWPVATGAS